MEGVAADRQSPESITVVLLGNFNPAIFHPLWFARANLIRQEEANAVQNLVIVPEVAEFTADWFKIQVTTDRFTIATADPTKYLPLRDLILGTFTLLEHSPLRALGLNTEQNLEFSSEESWHNFGHHFAPKETWNKLLERPGMAGLSIQGKRTDSLAEYVLVKIEPSKILKTAVMITINHHFKLSENEAIVAGATRLFEILASEWDNFIGFRVRVSNQLFLDGK